MADYQEQTISGAMTQYTRCPSITMQNPRGDMSACNVRFDEEIVKTLPDGEVITSSGPGITVPFNPADVISLRDPATWALTGETITSGELYALLASAYWHYATERDNA
ncbi:MAG: hypothetical protein KA142_02860 [Chromatiaceae bacterium]|nr:hypothetical protein [Chromatiaceae bacterium]